MPSSVSSPLSFAVREALVQACGTVFHWRSGLMALFVSAGVPEPMVKRYVDQGLAKYKIARAVLDDLAQRGADGYLTMRLIPDAVLDALPDQPLRFDRLAELAHEMVPTPPFG